MSLGGDEVELGHADYTAVVTEIGGGLRCLQSAGRDLVVPFGRGEVRPRYRGAVLAPWVNRIVDGRYEFDGADYQLDITEPERHHALHGLVCWQRWDVLDATPSSVAFGHRLVPRPGYPFELDLVVSYTVDDGGLAWTVSATNTGDRRAPVGLAGHPYLAAAGPLDSWTLRVPARQVLEVTPDRLVPTELADVTGGPYDFSGGRPLAGVEVDHAFTGLEPDGDGMVRASVTDQDGHGVQCTWDPVALPWVQLHTADLPDPRETRLGLALEPMTSPPDAFNSGVDLVVLDPGAQRVASWRLTAV